MSESASPSTSCSRRAFMGGAAGSIGLLTFVVGGCEKKLTPADARSAGATLRTLTAAEVRTLDALGEILLPGSVAAGLTHYIDQQLSGPPSDSMLILKYLGVSPPHAGFYQGGLAGTEAAARAAHGKPFDELAATPGIALVTAMSSGQLDGWSGPPPGLWYFALRSDAIDVVYGTPEGFARLGVPYMAHIPPPSGWGA